MRELPGELRKVVVDIEAERGIPAAIVEKDYFVTEVIRVLSGTAGDGFLPAFCGGTSLSKAHNLINRMSEDVDFRVRHDLPNPEPTRSAQIRLRSKYKKLVINELAKAELLGKGEGEILAQNENKFIVIKVPYKSLFPPIAVLRPIVQIEITIGQMRLAPEKREISSVIGEMTKKHERYVTNCLQIKETVAEKLVSFTRRVSAIVGERVKDAPDERVVRHLYDVHGCLEASPRSFEGDDFHALVNEIVLADVEQFKTLDKDFSSNPYGQIAVVLDGMRMDKKLKDWYSSFVKDMVYPGQACPSFEEAAAAFENLTRRSMHNQLKK